MEILIVLIVVWVIVTLVGHASWVMIRAVIRLFSMDHETISPGLSTSSQEPSSVFKATSQERDLAASHRVLSHLITKGFLDSSEGLQLRKKLRDLEYGRSPQSGRAPTLPKTSIPSPPIEPALKLPVASPPRASTGHHADEVTVGGDVIEAILVKDPVGREPAMSDVSVAESTASEPPLSTSEMIGSFLAARNIRWGELVAGMLIVICSIGLVISLWSTMVDKHRAIPSLIFLGANAAIYASGFYTLGRWKLRHTSRAVLVIATLLVPLSVMAGLAAAERGVDAVRLDDPITLIVISIAASIYGWLVHRGGIALVRRHLATSMTLAVAVPTITLPLVPTAVRMVGDNAGWIIMIGSIAIAVATGWATRIGSRKERVGGAHVRSQFMVMGLGLFALCVAIGYTAIATGSTDSISFSMSMPIAIATIPALVATMSGARHLMTSARGAMGSMIATILCALSVAGLLAMFPPALTSEFWLWSWALAWTASGVVLGCWLRQPLLAAISMIPIALSTVLTSPGWISGLAWDETSLVRRVIGGEPMVAALLVGFATVGLAYGLRAKPISRWIRMIAGFWIAVAACSAMVLSISPMTSMGLVPDWTVSVVLFIGALAGAWTSQANSERPSAIGWAWVQKSGLVLGGLAIVLGWVSVFQPWDWGRPLTFASIAIWMRVGIAAAICWMLFCEFSRSKAVARHWHDLSVAAWLIVVVMACADAFSGNSLSAASRMLAMGSIGLLWSATSSRSVAVLRLSQMSTIAFAVVVSVWMQPSALFTGDAWRLGTAPWAWAITLVGPPIAWLMVRRGAELKHAVIQSRLGFLSDHAARFPMMPDGQTWCGVIGLTVLGSVWPWFVMLLAIFRPESFSGSPVVLPLCTFAALASVLAWRRVMGQSVDCSKFENACIGCIVVAVIAWSLGCGVMWLPMNAPARLIVATSGLAMVSWVIAYRRESWRWIGTIAPVVVTISSLALLAKHWWSPILDGELAAWFPALSVATWWILGSLFLLDQARRKRLTDQPVVSSALFAAALMVASATWLHSPIAWMQITSIGLIGWAVLMRGFAIRFPEPDTGMIVGVAIKGCVALAGSIGIASAVVVTGAILTRLPLMVAWANMPGLVLSVIVFGLVATPKLREFLGIGWTNTNHAWPIGISLMAGQIAYATYALGWLSGPPLVVLIVAVWLSGSAASVVRSAWRTYCNAGDETHSARAIGLGHVATIALISGGLAWFGGSFMAIGVMQWLVLGSFALLGLQVATIQSTDPDPLLRTASNILGWFVIVGGAAACRNLLPIASLDWVWWTIVIVWAANWWTVWRIAATRQTTPSHATPDTALVNLFSVAMLGEISLVVLGESWSGPTLSEAMATIFFSIRWLAYVSIPLVGILLSKRRTSGGNLVAIAVAAASLLSVFIVDSFETDVQIRWMVAALSSGFMVAAVSHSLPLLLRIHRTADSANRTLLINQCTRNTSEVASLVAVAGIVASVFMIVFNVADSQHRWVTQLTVLSVAMAAWAMAVLAELTMQSRMRHVAVGMAMTTAALMASVSPSVVTHPILETTMRWLVASVIAIPMWLIVFPKLLGKSLCERWNDAFRSGAIIGDAGAVGSLVTMLAIEIMLRFGGGVEDISRTMVGGVAVTLALMSALSAVIAIRSGPKMNWPSQWQISDRGRQSLVIASQVIGAICWLHLYLCKSPWR